MRHLPRGVRAEEPERAAGAAGGGRRLVDDDAAAGGRENNPNLLLMRYDAGRPGQRPGRRAQAGLHAADRREAQAAGADPAAAGWVGCNILLGEAPEPGKVALVREGVSTPKADVLAKFRETLFLRRAGPGAWGWLIEVLKCAERIGSGVFTLEETYGFEAHLAALYPDNDNVRPKIRQQLHVLREAGLVTFLRPGRLPASALRGLGAGGSRLGADLSQGVGGCAGVVNRSGACAVSLFSSIVDKIFHHGGSKPAATPAAAPAPGPTAAATAPQPAPAPAAAAPAQPVDVEAVLEEMASAEGGGGNWRTSIVDLLKLLDLDSSLAARKDLANELNVHAGADGSAEENVALSKAVWKALADNGGHVPASLKD